jgi:hypothetical protein
MNGCAVGPHATDLAPGTPQVQHGGTSLNPDYYFALEKNQL